MRAPRLHVVFGRKSKSEQELQEQAALSDRPRGDGAKGRPTPKRRDQEAARRRPLVQNDPKAAKSADRAARREQSMKMRQAMMTGDDRNLPPRDKGPVRRYVRDAVDRRFNLGEMLLLLMLAVLVMSVIAPSIATLFFLGVYVLFALAVLDAVLLWRRTKKGILAKFGEDTDLKGLPMYAGMRSFQMRRTRMPKPQVERGAPLS
ncbi:DUF3043 domain-containing protein [Janibacter melonis]